MGMVLIVAGGPEPGAELLRTRAEEAGFVVCADSGAEVVARAGLVPAVVIGDFDSISAGTLERMRAAGAEVLGDADTEATDLEKAVRLATRRAPGSELVVLGATAGRLDHLIGHLGLMLRHAPAVRIVLEDEFVRAYVGGPELTFDLPVGTTVSFFAAGEPARNVTTEGLRYPLDGALLVMGGRESISNVVAARPARVTSDGGTFLVVEVKRAGHD